MLPLCLLAAALAQAAMSPAERSAIERAVLEVNDRTTAAAESLDADRLYSYMLDTDKGSVVQGGAIVPTRAQALEQTKRSFAGLRKVEYRWKHRYVTVLSPEVALLVGDGESSFTTAQGDTFTMSFAQTAVFVLTGGQWKIQHAHHSTTPRR